MAKPKTSFLCSVCGDDFPKWFGKCPSCGEWGSLSEFKVLNKRYDKSKSQNDLNNLNQVLSRDIEERVEMNRSNNEELYRMILEIKDKLEILENSIYKPT